MASYLDKVKDFYRPFIEKAPATSCHAAGWARREDQLLRFVTMAGMLDFLKEGGVTCLDVGCGVGDFKSFLTQSHPDADIDYTGIDVCPEMIRKAAENYQGRFLVQSLMDMDTHTEGHQTYDYVIACGIFNSPGYEDASLVMRLVEKMFQLCDIGVAFNFLEKSSKRAQIPGLVYHDGGEIFRRCKQVTDRVVLLSDYNVGEGDSTAILYSERYLDNAEQEHMQEAYEEQERRKAMAGNVDPAGAALSELNFWTCPSCGTKNPNLVVHCKNVGCNDTRPGDLDKPHDAGPDLKIIK